MNDKQRVLDSVERLIQYKNYSEITLAEILHLSGIDEERLALHFRDKDDIFFQLIERQSNANIEKIKVDLEKVADPIEKLRKLLQCLLRYSCQSKNAILIHKENRELSMKYQKSTIARRHELEVRKFVEDVIRICNKDNILVSYDTELLASLMLLLVFSYLEYGHEVSSFKGKEDQLIEMIPNLFMVEKVVEAHNGAEVGSINDYRLKLKQIEGLSNELNCIFQSSYDGLLVADGKAVVLKVNSAYERITGINEERILGKNLAALLKNKEINENPIVLKALQDRDTVTITHSYDGNNRVLITATPFFKDSVLEKVIVNLRDITELQKMCKELDETKEIVNQYKYELEELRERNLKNVKIITQSKAMGEVMLLANRVAKYDSTVLITGETGVGKEVLAQYIHRKSSRVGGPFIKTNCGAIPENLLESELFGFEKGSFTGANEKGKPGLFEVANNGTIFLDEIGELPVNLQSKLLTVLQDFMITRIGATKPTKVNVRIIAATNRNLREMIERKHFREDLYYRLSVFPIQIPPLRERREDVIPLVSLFLQELNRKYHGSKALTPEAQEALIRYSWPGNIREMRNVIEMLYIMADTEVIDLDLFPDKIKSHYADNILPLHQQVAGDSLTYREVVEDLEKEIIIEALQKFRTLREAGEALGISHSTIVKKMKKYDLKYENIRGTS